MNWSRTRSNSPGTGGLARSDVVADGSNVSSPSSFVGIKENHFDLTTTPALRLSLLFQKGNCSSFSANSFSASIRLRAVIDRACRAPTGPCTVHDSQTDFHWRDRFPRRQELGRNSIVPISSADGASRRAIQGAEHVEQFHGVSGWRRNRTSTGCTGGSLWVTSSRRHESDPSQTHGRSRKPGCAEWL